MFPVSLCLIHIICSPVQYGKVVRVPSVCAFETYSVGIRVSRAL